MTDHRRTPHPGPLGTPRFDAIVLAGGRASRLGVPKPGLVVAGRSLLEHVLAATTDAETTVVVGPPDLADTRYLLTREDPPFGGPVAGLAAGLALLEQCSGWVLVLACDVPRAAAAVPRLLAAVAETTDAVYLVRDGRPQWLVGIYRRSALDTAVDRLSAQGPLSGLPVRRLVTGLRTLELPDDAAASTDVDTWEDAARYEGTMHAPHGRRETS